MEKWTFRSSYTVYLHTPVVCMCVSVCVCKSMRSSHVIFTHFFPTDSPNLSLPLHASSRALKGSVCSLMNVFQNGSHREEGRALDAARREASVRELLHIPRWALWLCGFLSKVLKTDPSCNIKHNADGMKMHHYPCVTTTPVTSHHNRS